MRSSLVRTPGAASGPLVTLRRVLLRFARLRGESRPLGIPEECPYHRPSLPGIPEECPCLPLSGIPEECPYD